MKYIAKSCGGIVYAVFQAAEDYAPETDEQEISVQVYEKAALPAVFGEDGALIHTEEEPALPAPAAVELPEPEPTEEDDAAAMLVDHEYRLTLLELGLTE